MSVLSPGFHTNGKVLAKWKQMCMQWISAIYALL